MIWLLLGGIPLLIAAIAIFVIDPKAFFEAFTITVLLGGSVAGIMYGLHQLGVLQ